MKSAVVLFSGGVDSTYLVFKNAPLYDRLILITYKVPGMINVNFSRRSAQQLINFFGSKISHKILNIKKFIYSVRGNVYGCIKDNLKYGFYCSWCLGCRISMHLSTIKFCKENNIFLVLEGSNFYDPESLPQNKEILDILNTAYREEGVVLTTPCYYEENISLFPGRSLSFLRRIRFFKDVTAFRFRYLKEGGIDLGPGLVSQYRSSQPSCLTSVCFNSLRAILKYLRKENKEGYLKYVKNKINRWDQLYKKTS
jgi:hypothetical protein